MNSNMNPIKKKKLSDIKIIDVKIIIKKNKNNRINKYSLNKSQIKRIIKPYINTKLRYSYSKNNKESLIIQKNNSKIKHGNIEKSIKSNNSEKSRKLKNPEKYIPKIKIKKQYKPSRSKKLIQNNKILKHKKIKALNKSYKKTTNKKK